MFERVDAISFDHRFHFIMDHRRPLGDRHMQRIIRSRFFTLMPPSLIGLEHGFARCWQTEIDHHRGAARECRLRARFKIIRRHCAHKRHFQMCVRINAARHHITATSINNRITHQLVAHGHNLSVLNQNIGAFRKIVINNSAAADEGCGH